LSRWPKCPKCKQQNVTVTELWKDDGLIWEPGAPANEGIAEPGAPYKVQGKCLDCGHTWRFRCIIQVNPEWWDKE
jgi:hypothetical protein